MNNATEAFTPSEPAPDIDLDVFKNRPRRTLVDRLREQHHDLAQGAYYTTAEDHSWDATLDAAAILDIFRPVIEAGRRWRAAINASPTDDPAADSDLIDERLGALGDALDIMERQL